MLNTYPCNPFPISSEQLHKGDNEDLQAQINAIKDGSVIDSFGDVETALDTKADNDVIAPEFDAEAGTYEIGDKVMYEGKLYEFTSAHETAGEWDPTEVTETTVADELSSLESGLTNVNNDLSTKDVSNSLTCAVGTFVLQHAYTTGKVASVSFEIALTTDLAPSATLVSGCPKTKGSFIAFAIINDTTKTITNCYIDNQSIKYNGGAAITSGSVIKGSIIYVMA